MTAEPWLLGGTTSSQEIRYSGFSKISLVHRVVAGWDHMVPSKTRKGPHRRIKSEMMRYLEKLLKRLTCHRR